jgi:cytosine/adenosine deaminase-related metal-dependent hydrolase
LVDAHCHLELSYLKGALPAGRGFASFASSIGTQRKNYSDEERYAAMQLADQQLWEQGVSVVGDIANGTSSFRIKEQSAIHYHTFAEVFGLQTHTLDSIQPLLQHKDCTPTPHATYSLSDAPFLEVCHAGESPLSIHFMESSSEVELFQHCGTLYEWYQQRGWTCDFLHYTSPAQRLTASIPATRPLLLVHNCCVDQATIDHLLAHFTAPIWWCLCPRSNDYISGLRPPAELLRNNKLNICIGTDSLASNRSLSMVDELHLLGESIPLEERLQWATSGGAAALALDHEFGTLAPGRKPGVVLLTGVDFSTLQLRADAKTRRLV